VGSGVVGSGVPVLVAKGGGARARAGGRADLGLVGARHPIGREREAPLQRRHVLAHARAHTYTHTRAHAHAHAHAHVSWRPQTARE
jgi:hypothetical protein